MPPHGKKWDMECDILVIGSGGAGLTAALTAATVGADVIVAEAAPGLGGSTLFSGALAWVPNNHLMKAAGIADSTDEVLTYMEACMPGRGDEARWKAFAEAAPEMLLFRGVAHPAEVQAHRGPGFICRKERRASPWAAMWSRCR